MIAARIGSRYNGLSAVKFTATSSTPSATAFAAIAGRFVMRPSTSAARARSRTPTDSAEAIGNPTMPARRKMAMNAKSAEMLQTTVWSRFTGTPRSEARSALSALARIATPKLLFRRKIASAINATGATTTAIMSLALNTTVPISTSASNGGSSRLPSNGNVAPHSFGMRRAAAVRSCERPSDATVSSRRGDLKKRRMIANSTTAPSRIAPTMPAASDSPYDQCQADINMTMSTTGAVPRSPCAKFTNRFDR